MNLQTLQARAQSFGRDARGTQIGQRGGYRLVQRLGLGTLAFAQGPDAVVLLSQVDQVKIRAEGAHQLQQPQRRLALRPTQQRLVRSMARTLPNRGLADMLDIVEELR